MDKYDALKLENQLCFPLYACSREITRRYTPLLKPLGLTYTQYIVMIVMWEDRETTVGELSRKLYLDSGTLTPVLKKLEKAGLVKRCRSEKDERIVCVSVTDEGMALREKAVDIPARMGECIALPKKDLDACYNILYKILENSGKE